MDVPSPSVYSDSGGEGENENEKHSLSDNIPSPSVYTDSVGNRENGSKRDSLFDKLLEEVSNGVRFRGASPQSEVRDNERALEYKPEPRRKRWDDVRLAVTYAHNSAKDLSSILDRARRRMEIEERKWMANRNAF